MTVHAGGADDIIIPDIPDPDDCSSCGADGADEPEMRCPRSRRPCGHHCNHIWTHDHCDWCEWIVPAEQITQAAP